MFSDIIFNMRQIGISVFIFTWAAGISYAIAYMHGMHKVEFKPATTHLALDHSTFDTEYTLVHLLTEDCGCSQIIAEYLIERGKIKDTSEYVYFIGKSLEYKQELINQGFIVKEIKNEYIEGVPMLSVFHRNGEVKYSGGYSKKIITPLTTILDTKILEQVQNDTPTEQYIVQGCATSKKIISQIDPLGLKYKR